MDGYVSYNLFGIKCLLTAGVHEFAEKNGCYWLLNAILSHQIYPHVKNEEFQAWKLKRIVGDRYMLNCDDGNGNIIQEQEIEFSDYGKDLAVLWFVDGVLLLPSEY